MFFTSQNQGLISVFLLRFYFVSMAGGLDFHWCWILLINICSLAPGNCRTQNYMLFIFENVKRSLSSRETFYRDKKRAIFPASPHTNKYLSFIFKCWLTFWGCGALRGHLFEITLFSFISEKNYVFFTHRHGIWKSSHNLFAVFQKSWGHLFWPYMCIWGLYALGSVRSLSLSNHSPSSWSSRRLLCACMCTSNLVFRPQKVLLWCSQPDHILWYFPDDQSISIQCRQNLSQLLLMFCL